MVLDDFEFGGRRRNFAEHSGQLGKFHDEPRRRQGFVGASFGHIRLLRYQPAYCGGCTAPLPLADPEYDEFRGLDRRDADFDVAVARFNHLRGIGLRVAFYKKGLLGRLAEQGSLPPEPRQVGGDIAPYNRPQQLVVRLEDDPSCIVSNGVLDVREQALDVDIPPRHITRQCARAPDADALAGKGAYAINARWEFLLIPSCRAGR